MLDDNFYWYLNPREAFGLNKDYFDIAHNNLRETIKNRIGNIDGGKLFETDDFLIFTIGIPSEDGHLNGCLSFNDKAYKSTFN